MANLEDLVLEKLEKLSSDYRKVMNIQKEQLKTFKNTAVKQIKLLKYYENVYHTEGNVYQEVESQAKHCVEKAKAEVGVSLELIKRKETEVEDLRLAERLLADKLTAKENLVQKVKDEISAIDRKKMLLEPLRNKAKLLKLISSTCFEYQGPNIAGLIVNNDKIKAFYFNPTEMEQTDITENLWNTLEKVFSEDYEAIKDYYLDKRQPADDIPA